MGISARQYQELVDLCRKNGMGSTLHSLIGDRDSLRDKFAASAIQGLLAMQSNPSFGSSRQVQRDEVERVFYAESRNAFDLVEEAYRIADTALEVRTQHLTTNQVKYG